MATQPLIAHTPATGARATGAIQTAGTVAIVLGLSKIHAAVVARPAYDLTASARLSWEICFVVVLSVAAYATGLPSLPTRRRGAYAAVVATLCGAIGISLCQLALGSALLPRFVVFGSMLLVVPWYAACREMAADSAGRDGERNRVIAVGDLADLTLLDDDLAASGARRVQLVDRLATAEAASAGHGSPLVERAVACGATVVVLTRTAQQDETVVVQAAELHHRGLRVRTLSRFYEDWLGKFPMGELERISLLFDISEVHHGPYSRVKRMIDVALSVCGLPVLVVAVPAVALANRFGNRGPLLFRQERVGKNGRRFEMLKFRTMVPGSSDGSWTADDDPRVTRMGRVLRTTHVDELPQLVNILRGELSFVGPRPEQPRYVDELVGKIPFYELRHLVRPGLTGWAQINYGYAGNEHDALEKLQYDFFYLRHQRLRFDLRIVARTLRTVFQRHGR